MKPLTLEEAEANIGKEVVYIGTDEYVKRNERKYNFYLKRIESFDCVTNIHHIAVVAMGGIGRVCRLPIDNIPLKQPLKIGDIVKLDPSTKPYTVTNWKGRVVERTDFDEDSEEHTIMSIHADGDILIDNMGYIHPRHLIKVEKKNMTADQLIKRNTVEDATHIGIKSKLFSIFSDETRFLWVNGQWIECGYINDDFEPVTIGIDTGKDESTPVGAIHIDVEVGFKVKEVSAGKPRDNHVAFTPEEIDLRERIAFKLLEVDRYTYHDLCAIYNVITGK